MKCVRLHGRPAVDACVASVFQDVYLSWVGSNANTRPEITCQTLEDSRVARTSTSDRLQKGFTTGNINCTFFVISSADWDVFSSITHQKYAAKIAAAAVTAVLY